MSATPPPHAPRHRTRPAIHRLHGWLLAGRYRLPTAIVGVAVLLATVIVALTWPSATSHNSARPPIPPSPAATTSTHTGSIPSRSVEARPAIAPPRRSRRTHPHFECHASSAAAGGGDAPAGICIPAIGVDASVMKLGLNPDRTVEVPPLSRVRDAGWYRFSAAPGVVGPTVILGHVDSATYGEGVFYRLGQMRAGDTVTVTRSDRMIATFRIDRVQEIAKSHFPTDDVYGSTSGPSLRLVTCGGQFDSATHNYLDNIIAYGTLTSLRHA